MSIYKNGKLIAGGRQTMPLLSFMWADHICNDAQWLRADTFSWQSGAVYQAAYAHLVLDIDGKTLQSETIGGTTIQFYLADDGHKICPASEENNVVAIYTATGVAWYYIIDTTNQRFKLPRAKHNKYAATLRVVGNGMTIAITDGNRDMALFHGTQNGNQNLGLNSKGVGTPVGTSYGVASTSNALTLGLTQDPTKSGIIAQQEQDIDQYKYLYFYVGQFTQTALENTAGVTTEVLNTKVTVGHEVIEFQEPIAANNYTWYRKYRDGWVEQGGIKPANTTTVDFPVTMANNDYWYIVKGNYDNSSGSYASSHDYVTTRNTTGFVLSTGGTTACWEVKGMAA